MAFVHPDAVILKVGDRETAETVKIPVPSDSASTDGRRMSRHTARFAGADVLPGMRSVSVRAAADAPGPRLPVRYLSSILMPADELCFHLFEAPSVESVRAASERAGLEPIRVIEVVTGSDLGPRGSSRAARGREE
jgi:hypothetical protein